MKVPMSKAEFIQLHETANIVSMNIAFEGVAIAQRTHQLFITCKEVSHLMRAFSLLLYSQHRNLMTI